MAMVSSTVFEVTSTLTRFRSLALSAKKRGQSRLTGTAGMPPQPFTIGRWSRDIGALRGTSSCPDICRAGYRA